MIQIFKMLSLKQYSITTTTNMISAYECSVFFCYNLNFVYSKPQNVFELVQLVLRK